MRQVREVLRLKHVCGHSGRQIAVMLGVSRYTVAEYLRRAAVVGSKREPIPTFPGFAVSADIAASFWAERWTNGRVLIRGA
jgi:hypothetical protein